VVVLVEQDRHGAKPRHLPRAAHHLGNSPRLVYAVAVQQQEIRSPDHLLARDRAAAVACADQQAAACVPPSLHLLDQFVDALGP
jgi:hypothetical protein